MRCEDLFATLADYLDGDLDEETARDIQRHLEECPLCELVVDNIRKAIRAYSVDPVAGVPATLHDHLSEVLQRHWKAKFSARQRRGSAGGVI